jgi:response regulator RpfG family c-di-GMP phosphodiesterase
MELPGHDEVRRVLFVDDEENVLRSLKRLFFDVPFEVFTAASGKEALDILREKEIAVIISDQRMPEMDGAQFLEKSKVLSPQSIRMVLTGYADMNAAMDAINRGGASRYITKPWRDDELAVTVKDAVEMYRLTKENIYLTELTKKQNEELQKWSSELELDVQQQSIDLTRQNQDLTALNEKLDRNLDTTITSFANLIELRDKTVRNHSANVAAFSVRIAKLVSLPENEIENISIASQLHDIGKIGTPDMVLMKDPSTLSSEEMIEYRKHPILGQSAVDVIEELRDAGVLIRHHHEALGGTGFPDGIGGNDIPLGSRIIAIADFFDRRAVVGSGGYPVARTLTMIESMLNTHFDPQLFAHICEIAQDAADTFVLSEGSVEMELPPRELSPGMVVSRDIRTGTGLMLLTRGAALTEKHIEIIQRCYHLDPAQTGVYVRIEKSRINEANR